MRIHRLFLLLAVASASPALAAVPVVVPSTSNLLPDTPNQLVEFFITGSDLVAGESLSLQINNGASGPVFTSLNPINSPDPFAGTIFAGNNLGQLEAGILDSGPYAGRLALAATLTASGTVLNHGTLISVLVSTGPVDSSPFTISLVNTVNGPSYLAFPDQTAFSPMQPHSKLSIGAAPVRTWAFNGGGTWNNDVRWSPFAPYTIGDQAHFLGALTSGDATITLDGNRTVGALLFDNPARGYTIAQGTGGTLHLNNGALPASITVVGGQHTINAPVSLQDTTRVAVAAGSSLTLAGPLAGTSTALQFQGPGTLRITGPATYSGSTTITSGQLYYGGGHSHAIAALTGTGHVMVAAGTTLTSDGIIADTLEVQGTHILRAGGGHRVASRVGSLILGGSTGAWTGKLDLQDNVLVLPAADAPAQAALLDQLRDAVASGRAGGTWMGTGITSSALAGSALLGMAIVDAGDLEIVEFRGIDGLDAHTTLILATPLGDATLDDHVDAYDLNVLAAHWQMSTGLWSCGDFTGDGTVDAFDLNAMAAAWQFDGGYPSFSAVAAVPEPSSLALLGMGAGLLARRRRVVVRSS